MSRKLRFLQAKAKKVVPEVFEPAAAETYSTRMTNMITEPIHTYDLVDILVYLVIM